MDGKTCFFIGSRYTSDNIKEKLTEVIEKHIVEYGVTTGKTFQSTQPGCGTKGGTCGDIYIMLGGKKRKAIAGKNVFRIILDGEGNIVLPNTCDFNANSNHAGADCLRKVISNGWKIPNNYND